MLQRWGEFAARRHWWVFTAWVVVMVAVWAIGFGLGAKPNNNFTLPGASSQEALDLLGQNFPAAAGTSATVIYHSPDGTNVTTDPTLKLALENSITALRGLNGVASVTGPFSNPALLSKSGATALVNVSYEQPFQNLPDNGHAAFDALSASVAKYRTPSLQIELGGSLPGSQPIDVKPVLVLYGLIIALIILLVTLSTWWSFAWPVVGALVGVGLGVGLVRILENFIDVPTISETTAVMIGLGVGIDYGLFVISRTKDHLEAGDAPDVASGRALATIGHAVLTAGATVVVALVALLVFEVPSVTAIAYAVVLVVAAVVLASLTLLPAIVGMVGPRLASSRVAWAPEAVTDPERTRMGRWATLVGRRAPAMLAGAIVVLLVLAIPVFSGDLRLGPLDNSLFPTDSTQYRAWDLQTQAFGAGSTDPFLVVVEIPTGDAATQAQLTALFQDLQQAPDVAAVTPPQLNPSGSTAVFQVIPASGAQSGATASLVTHLRDNTLPQATAGTPLTALVTGRNAVFVDLDDRVADRLPLFIALVVLVALVILGSVFRSVWIPVKAAIFNIITILATYGVLVAFLTFGWGRSWIGIPANIPILSLLAPVFFAVLFGLSNDYEVYLVSRMREERETFGASESVRRGLAEGGHIVIAAAFIMIFVFVSYVFQPGAPVKQFGFGMTVAILIDALVTRMTAVPAVMHLGGDKMWWPGRRSSSSSPPSPTPSTATE